MSETWQRAQAGMDLVESNTDEDWVELAEQAVIDTAREFSVFTTEDIWDRLEGTRNNSSLGPIMKRAATHGICKGTGISIDGTRPTCHGRPTRVWRSLICLQEGLSDREEVLDGLLAAFSNLTKTSAKEA